MLETLTDFCTVQNDAWCIQGPALKCISVLGCHFSWLWGGFMKLRVYLCPCVPPARTWQKTAAWLSSAWLWCLLMAPKCAQAISCSAQMSLLMHFLFFVCVHLKEIMCVYICFLAICSFPPFQTLRSHIKIDIHLRRYLDTEIYFSPDVRQQTDSRPVHYLLKNMRMRLIKQTVDVHTLGLIHTQLSAQIRWIQTN